MARSLIACLLLLSTAAPAQAALVVLDPHRGDDIVWQATMPGAAEFNRLSRPMPVRFSFLDAVGKQELDLVDLAGDDPAVWRPRTFQPADDAITLTEGPGQAGWMPLVGGLALVAYRIRRGKRRFRFRSAV